MADNTDDLIISISTDQATLRRSIKRIEAPWPDVIDEPINAWRAAA